MIKQPLELIFDPTENIIVSQTAKKYELSSLGKLAGAAQLPNFYAINPSVGRQRGNEHAAVLRNFLFESDTIPVDVQKSAILQINSAIPLRLVTFSGSKSVHYIVSLAEQSCGAPGVKGLSAYRVLWQALYNEISAVLRPLVGANAATSLLDPATKDVMRFSRTPGAYRNEVKQDLLFSGNLLTQEAITALLAKYKVPEYIKSPVEPEMQNFITVAEFTKLIDSSHQLADLRFKLKRAEFWAASQNCYEKIFKLALWCIDSTGVPKHVLLPYFEAVVFPKLLAAGYPLDKLDKGIYDAYNHKGIS